MSFSNTAIADNVLADNIEALAWQDFFSAAPPDMGCEGFALPGTRAMVLRARAFPIPILNRVIGLAYTDLHGDLFPSLMQYYRNAQVDEFWVHAWMPKHDGAEPPAIELGSRPESRWCKFLFDLDGGMPMPSGPRPGSLAAARPARPAEADLVATVICRSHGMPPTMIPWFSALVGRPGWHFFVVDGAERAPVAAGALFIDGDRAWLGMGGTVPDARGQGAQYAVLAARLAAARELGCRVAAVETGLPSNDEPSPSLNNIRRIGFRAVGIRRNVAFHASPQNHEPQQGEPEHADRAD